MFFFPRSNPPVVVFTRSFIHDFFLHSMPIFIGEMKRLSCEGLSLERCGDSLMVPRAPLAIPRWYYTSVYICTRNTLWMQILLASRSSDRTKRTYTNTVAYAIRTQTGVCTSPGPAIGLTFIQPCTGRSALTQDSLIQSTNDHAE